MKFALLYSLNPISLFLYSPSLTSVTSASIPWKSSSSKRERERQIDDEAEEKAINASQKKEEVLRMWEEEMKERAF